MHSSSHYFSYLFLHGNVEMAKTGRGPFCEYFCKLTRMCKVLKVLPFQMSESHVSPCSRWTELGVWEWWGADPVSKIAGKLRAGLRQADVMESSVEEVCMVWMRAWLYMDLFRNISLANPPPWIASSTSLSSLQWNLECSKSHCWVWLNCKWGTTGASWE